MIAAWMNAFDIENPTPQRANHRAPTLLNV
jgi:hypothetical protein